VSKSILNSFTLNLYLVVILWSGMVRNGWFIKLKENC